MDHVGALNYHKKALGGPDGELGASLRYLSQSYSMSNNKVANLLRDIATEELAHLEMVGTIVMQLTKNLTIDQIEREGFDKYFVDHTVGVYPQAAAGVPYTAAFMQSKGDPITDLFEDMAADATTAKEQSLFPRTRKPLILLAFRHFEAFCKNGIPATL